MPGSQRPEPDYNASPFNAIPPVVVALVGAMALVEAALALGQAGLAGGPEAVGWRRDWLLGWGFLVPLWDWMLSPEGVVRPRDLLRLVSYPFIHGDITHALFAGVITLAMGKFVGAVLRPVALLSLWLLTTVMGALGYAWLTGSQQVLFGAMPPAYGLIGAYTFILWARARVTGQSPAAAFRMIGLLVVLQVLFAAMAGSVQPSIAAELVAFAAGFVAMFGLAPGGWTATRQLLQR